MTAQVGVDQRGSDDRCFVAWEACGLEQGPGEGEKVGGTNDRHGRHPSSDHAGKWDSPQQNVSFAHAVVYDTHAVRKCGVAGSPLAASQSRKRRTCHSSAKEDSTMTFRVSTRRQATSADL